MSLSADLRMYGRFAAGLPGFLRRRVDVGPARSIVRHRMATRDEAFLTLLRRGVFENSASPMRRLLDLADCGIGDVARMVRADGLEATLHALHEAGVYVTFDEFKGREPIVRHGREIPADAEAFDNPYLRHYYEGRSSGSTGGAGTRIPIDLDHTVEQMAVEQVLFEAHGLTRLPTAIWRGILPGSAGIQNILKGALRGNVPRRWFTPVTGADVRSPLTYRLATQFVVRAGRLLGHPFPVPEIMPLDDPGPLVRWMRRALDREGGCLVRTFVSMALRTCLAARDRGVDLSGAVLMGGGEPPTTAKVQQMTASGARFVPNYSASEIGRLGAACANPTDVNDLHVVKSNIALIQRDRSVPGFDVTVGAFCITPLQPTAPKLVVNLELDDCGILETRSCGCPLEAFGFTEHIRGIRSYRKLTGEGVSLVDSEVVRVLEEVLPARFGGTPLDYQLVEEEDERAFTRLTLVISPDLKIADTGAVVRSLLGGLTEGGVSAAFASAFWGQGESIRVRRARPHWTARGKFMPLCVAERLASARRENAAPAKRTGTPSPFQGEGRGEGRESARHEADDPSPQPSPRGGEGEDRAASPRGGEGEAARAEQSAKRTVSRE